MSAVRFVDTNVLIYAASPSPQEAEKLRRAQNLLHRGDLALSVSEDMSSAQDYDGLRVMNPLTGQGDSR